jgi:hypothetical protein
MNPDSPNDQREDDGCSLLFDSEPLEQDIEILGAPVVTLALASDQSNAFIVARLNDVAPDGASTRVTYGVLNLTHRISHENPEPLTPGKIYLVEVRLNDIAQCFPRGHRIRLALSNTMWPMFWPSPRRVALTLHTKDSQLSLPVRKQRASDTALPAFESPQSATPQVAETLEQPEYVRRIEKDETNGDSRVTVIDDTGLTHLPLLGWRHGSTSRHYFSINDDDPNSARAHVHWTTRHMDIRVETQSTLTSDENMFHIDASLDAYEGEEKFYSKTWRKSVKRQWN